MYLLLRELVDAEFFDNLCSFGILCMNIPTHISLYLLLDHMVLRTAQTAISNYFFMTSSYF